MTPREAWNLIPLKVVVLLERGGGGVPVIHPLPSLESR